MIEPEEIERLPVNHPRRRLKQNVMDFYFQPKRIERWKNGKLYEVLGVRIFKKAVVSLGHFFGLDSSVENSYFINDRSANGLAAYEKRTRRSEAIHSPITIFLTYGVISALLEERYAVAIVAGILGALNGFPTALQRYNRVRIENVVFRMQSRKSKVGTIDNK
jgi:hypothetical protein